MKKVYLLILLIINLMSCNTEKNNYVFDDYPVFESEGLELTYSPQKSVFTLWSPAAYAVRLNIYDSVKTNQPARQFKLKNYKDGAWQVEIEEDLKGMQYTFEVSVQKDVWLKETPGIWAKAVTANGLRAVVVNMNETNPADWYTDKYVECKNPTDAIIYEMHIRDFSVSPTSGITHKGKFLSLTETGTKTPQGLASGIDHLKELGITHVHLLPSFDFASIDETNLSENKYNWGYEPLHFNTPEGSYTTNPNDAVLRIREFKQMVQNLHKNGIGVIMDVVYNHTTSVDNSPFDLTAPGYFYRQDENGVYTNASACQNETASEREMVRRYIIESVKYWMTEYHIDGFRFDLMGIHDILTMNNLSSELKKINPYAIVYGEGWTAGDSPLPIHKRATKANAIHFNDVAVFSDDIRDALKGNYAKPSAQGFVTGAVSENIETVKFGLIGAVKHPEIDYSKILYTKTPYANNPTQVVNYVSCHDDLCLVDKLLKSAPENAKPQDFIKFNKLAQTIVFVAQGIPFIRAGEELHHDKKGVHNSFESPDSINQIDWSNKAKYSDLFIYYKQLIELRKSFSGFRMVSAEQVRKNIAFIDTGNSGTICYTIKQTNDNNTKTLLVALNGNLTKEEISIPNGNWTVVCKDGIINLDGIEKISTNKITIEPSTAIILWK